MKNMEKCWHGKYEILDYRNFIINCLCTTSEQNDENGSLCQYYLSCLLVCNTGGVCI